MNVKFIDPVVEEVRDFRKGIVQVCAEKNEDYYSHLIALQCQFRERTVSFMAKPDIEQLKCSGQ